MRNRESRIVVGLVMAASAALAQPVSQNVQDVKFGPIPALPNCFKAAIENGDPGAGAFAALVKLPKGCVIPWHWHTANEHLMFVSGAARMEMKDMKPVVLKTAGFSYLPSKHQHQLTCTQDCTLFLYSDGKFDIHYVDPQGNEIPPEQALKGVNETAMR